jgi:hypothetical protein
VVNGQLTGLNVSTGQFTHWAEVDTNEFTESGRVVVTDSLGVTERLQYWIGLNDLILQIALLFVGREGTGISDVTQQVILNRRQNA